MSASAKPEMDAAAAKGDDMAEAGGSGSGWELLYCGGTNFQTMDQEGVSGPQGNLLLPTRLEPLVGVNIRFVATGCTACHCVALDAEGKCYTWGRNEKGQLGLGDTLLRKMPTVVDRLLGHHIKNASVGRNHTVVVTTDTKSFSFGDNKHGQLGTSSLSTESESFPVVCSVDQATDVFCGADFTVWLSIVTGSSILTAGLSQYGQLGHGTDNECNAKDSSGKLKYDPQSTPKAIKALKYKRILKVACGNNHTVAVDSTGVIYTWGCGEHGRLGHGDLKDVLEPRPVEFFKNININPENAIVSAGFASSACTNGAIVFLHVGGIGCKRCSDSDIFRAKGSKEFERLLLFSVSHLHDEIVLLGWSLQHMASGNRHHIVAGEVAGEGVCLSWGSAMNGELGYGPNNGEKYMSSGKPKTVDILAGMRVTSVGCGYGLSLFTVDRAIGGSRICQLHIYKGDTPMEEAKEPSESEGDDNGDESDPGYGEKKTKARRGRGVKRKTPVPKRRGRGQPDDTDSSALEVGSSSRGGKRGRRGNRGKRGPRE